MKAEKSGFLTKSAKGYPTKRLENHEKRNLSLSRGYMPMKEKRKRFLTKNARGYPRKRAGKS